MWLITGTREQIQSVFCKSRRLPPLQNNVAGKLSCIKHCHCTSDSVKGSDLQTGADELFGQFIAVLGQCQHFLSMCCLDCVCGNILCIELVFAGGAETPSSIDAAQDRIHKLYLALHLLTCLQGRYTNVGGQNSCIRFSLPSLLGTSS